MSQIAARRGPLLLLISLAALISTAAIGAVREDTAGAMARRAPERNVPSRRRGPPVTTPQAHAALRQRMVGSVHRPAGAVTVPARGAAKARPVIGSGAPGR